jgi:hypothetical protein
MLWRAFALLLVAVPAFAAMAVAQPDVLLARDSAPTAGVADAAVPPGWLAVLDRFVDDRGRVDFAALASDRADLDATIAYLASTSPASDPARFASRSAQLAYYVNAYNALSMYNVIDSGIPASLSGLRKFWFFGVKKFAVGGTPLSLYTLENDVIRPLHDERVHFALNCMSVACPRLPRLPFTTAALEAQLDAAAREFFAEPRNLAVETGPRRIRVSEILAFYTEDFLRVSPDLVTYINRYHSPAIPGDFSVEFIPYDWTVNAAPRRP